MSSQFVSQVNFSNITTSYSRTNTRKETPLCTFFNSSRGCNKGDSCPFVHILPSETETKVESKSTKLCTFFGTPKGCNKGNACPYRHEVSIIESKSVSTIPSTSTKLCTFFGTSKGCNKGDACPYRHEDSTTESKSIPIFVPSNTSTKLCTFFGTPKGCKNGINCPYKHEIMPSENKSVSDSLLIPKKETFENSNYYDQYEHYDSNSEDVDYDSCLDEITEALLNEGLIEPDLDMELELELEIERNIIGNEPHHDLWFPNFSACESCYGYVYAHGISCSCKYML